MRRKAVGESERRGESKERDGRGEVRSKGEGKWLGKREGKRWR